MSDCEPIGFNNPQDYEMFDSNLCIDCEYFSNIGGPYCEKDGTAEIPPPFKDFKCFKRKEVK